MQKHKLTVKEAKLAQAKAKGLTHDKAWDEAGYSQNSSKATKVANTQKILSKPNVQEAFQQAMAAQGITIEKIVKPIADGLEAEKVHIVGNGDQAMAEITPDHSIRLKASDMAQKLMGVKANQEGGGVNVHFHQHLEGQKDKYGF